MKTKLLIGFVIVILIVIILAVGGWYPVARVNGWWINARTFRKEKSAALNFETQLLAHAKLATSTAPITDKELSSAVLEGEIQRVLIEQKLGSDLEPEVLRYLVEEKLKTLEGDTTLQTNTESLYGFSFSEVRDLIFIPQAKRDILASRLFLEHKSLEKWLLEARQNARITTFTQ